ncbi:MAG: hypothetical protein ABI672_08015 [Vicinamibacteria bacterium]
MVPEETVTEAGLDSLLSWARLLTGGVSILWILASARVRRAEWILAAVVSWCVYLWAISNLPLGRMYAVGVGHDRLMNLALCTPVAAGSPFYETYQVGQLNFEPFWSLFVAAISGWSADRVLLLYPVLALLVVVGFAVSFYVSPRALSNCEEGHWSGWEKVFAIYFALMFSTGPADHLEMYRSVWNVSFLLKPNHNLGLILLPPLLATLSGVPSWSRRLGAALLLHLIGWVFVIFWAYVVLGLLFYVALSRRHGKGRTAAVDVATVLGINLVLLSPYLFILLTRYSFLLHGPRLDLASVLDQAMTLGLGQGFVFLLALLGGKTLYSRADDLSRLWLSLALGAVSAWVGYMGLALTIGATETDEIYYFVRVMVGVMAGIGAWNVAHRTGELLAVPKDLRPAALLLVSFPLALPAWWDPVQMDRYFAGSRAPLPDSLVKTMSFIREGTEPEAAFLAVGEDARFVAGLGGRRVLYDGYLTPPPNIAERSRLQWAVLVEGDRAAARALRAQYGVRYVLISDRLMADYPTAQLRPFAARPGWRKVFPAGSIPDAELEVFELEATASSESAGAGIPAGRKGG